MKKINFLRLTAAQKSYFLTIIWVSLIIFATGFVVGFAGSYFHDNNITAGIFALVVATLFLAWVYMRTITFYFPSKAVQADITIKEAFQRTKGLLLKIIFAIFIVSILSAIIHMFAGAIIGGTFGAFFGIPESFADIAKINVVMALVLAPIELAAITTILVITSQYYLFSMGGKSK